MPRSSDWTDCATADSCIAAGKADVSGCPVWVRTRSDGETACETTASASQRLPTSRRNQAVDQVGWHWPVMAGIGAGDGNRTHGSSLGSLGITIIRRPRKLDSKRLTEVSANHTTGAPTGPVAAMPPGKPGVDQLTSATAAGLTPVVTIGVLSAVSDPSALMANCDTVLSLMFVAYAY